jgi:hypothetical protein
MTTQTINNYDRIIDGFITYVGSLLGIVGALLVASNSDVSAYGYICFTGSSVLLLLWSIKDKINHQLYMNLTYTAVNLYGLYNWFQP